ncbi:MAG: hypothetical protein A2315_04635 [Ignavibacteria bacterium RIFOXYB2_FULL_35_12]|nr:MAG: hypothetical protein A2058_06845 [Ignavibacteria bacterium GWA2_36_19]OGU54024.1 MAG: hypothetical protein A2006_08040 [Ignavibacteria bacterium GWC2_35_8]OGU57692.1 MAG: hypothetical protein A2X60_09855 [Ignavibacteria bacterium GWF2_35_20]OGU79843.1 MAG: hypothetical protein A2254_05445 [Ignavibacteria bacterium RIFOXYA2_FULL_35_9]OGU89609.1 MAG: hypothetical protein A3K31_15585 [Ignavibacteria bacterium RIFOXYA12_FULL_35_25]OGU94695.1 MAG: hypothetical protein A2347_03575 [Ignavibac
MFQNDVQWMAVCPVRDFGFFTYQDTPKLMRVFSFSNHWDPYWLYRVLTTMLFSNQQVSGCCQFYDIVFLSKKNIIVKCQKKLIITE